MSSNTSPIEKSLLRFASILGPSVGAAVVIARAILERGITDRVLADGVGLFMLCTLAAFHWKRSRGQSVAWAGARTEPDDPVEERRSADVFTLLVAGFLMTVMVWRLFSDWR
jgi:hypothetical protein